MTTSNLQGWRRLAAFLEASIVLGLPFIRIKGESALRFDIPTLRLHFFGTDIWMEEFFIVLIGIIFLTLLFIFITILFGRVWCGWACPQTVLSDLTSLVARASGRKINDKVLPWVLTLIVSIIVSADLIWYFVSPYEFFPRLFNMQLGNTVWAFWITLTIIMFLNLALLRQRFCATVCPYSMLQGALFDSRTLTVAFDPAREDECIDCKACLRACPVGIDIRDGVQRECIHCAKCIDKCSAIMGRDGKRTLIDYFWGLPGSRGKLLRQNVVIFGVMTVMALIFFLYLLTVRLPYGLTVLPNYDFAPRISETGEATNSYLLSITNRQRADMLFKAMASTADGDARLLPESDILVRTGESKKVPVYITIRKVGDQPSAEVEISIRAKGGDEEEIRQKTRFWFEEIR
jgi:cytochrome c oxidase accessory protein FixG